MLTSWPFGEQSINFTIEFKSKIESSQDNIRSSRFDHDSIIRFQNWTASRTNLLQTFLKSNSSQVDKILSRCNPNRQTHTLLEIISPLKEILAVSMSVCILIFSIQQTIRRCHKSDDIRNVAVQFEVTLDCVCLSKLSKQTYHLFPIAYMVHLAFNKSWVLTFNDTKRQCL